ncbi:MAG: SseB family protein [Planctomycetota bacterium]|jgi:hypothetical protein
MFKFILVISVIIAIGIAVFVVLMVKKKSNADVLSDRSINVNKAVENKMLVRAFEDYTSKQSPKNSQKVLTELNKGVFLIATIMDDAEMKGVESNEKTTLEKDSFISFLTCQSPEGDNLLPVFTDWEHVRKWTDENISGMIMPAQELWAFVLHDDTYNGIVINPSNHCVELNREQITNLTK